MWHINKKDDYSLELVSNDCDSVEGTEEDYHWWNAKVKWDGCIDLYRSANVPFCKYDGYAGQKRNESACDSYIHICDIDDIIKRLLKLRKIQKNHFMKKCK